MSEVITDRIESETEKFDEVSEPKQNLYRIDDEDAQLNIEKADNNISKARNNIQKTQEALAMLKELHREGKTVVLITHDNKIAHEADRIVRIKDGKIVFDSLFDGNKGIVNV